MNLPLPLEIDRLRRLNTQLREENSALKQIMDNFLNSIEMYFSDKANREMKREEEMKNDS